MANFIMVTKRNGNKVIINTNDILNVHEIQGYSVIRTSKDITTIECKDKIDTIYAALMDNK